MRILLISHFFLPKFNAGTENYTLGLAKGFQRNGHEVEVLCAEDWDSGENYWNGVTQDVYDGISVYRFHLNWLKANNPNKILYDSSIVENNLSQFLESNDYDIVHVTSAYSLGVGILRSIKRFGVPLVLTLMDFWFICPSVQLLRSDGSLCDGHTTAWECQSCLLAGSNLYQRINNAAIPTPIQSFVFGNFAYFPQVNNRSGFRGMLLNINERKRLLKQAITFPDKVISHSRIVKEMVSGVASIPIEELRNGYSQSWRQDYRMNSRENFLRFGFIGQILGIKGVHILVEAFQRSQLNGKASLDIWGDQTKDSNYTEKLSDLIGDNHSIKLNGRFEQDELPEVLAEIDVMVVPSLWYENSPLVIQEAFAAKIPIIATNLGGMAEAVTHELNGLLFERADVDDLARQIRRITEEPRLLEQLRKGIPTVKTITEEVNELETIYKEIISQ